MTVRNDIEFIMFLAEIGTQERKEHYREQYFGAPDGLAAEIAAEKVEATAPATNEPIISRCANILPRASLLPLRSHLTRFEPTWRTWLVQKVVAIGIFFRLAECIELHRSDKIHSHLADLRRRIVRDEAERKYPRHFKRHERRVPANYLAAVYMLGQKFRNDRAEQISRSGQKIIQRLAPVPAPELNRHEHEVRRLRVAEHAALLNISICAEKSADRYHDGKYPELFAFEKLFLFLRAFSFIVHHTVSFLQRISLSLLPVCVKKS